VNRFVRDMYCRGVVGGRERECDGNAVVKVRSSAGFKLSVAHIAIELGEFERATRGVQQVTP
jgi:hypothetical protein